MSVRAFLLVLPMTLLAGATPAPAAVSPAAIEREWRHYDADGRGALTALEFGRWIMAANGEMLDGAVENDLRSTEPGSIATRLLNATSAAFAQADADHDRLVSPEELVRFSQ